MNQKFELFKKELDDEKTRHEKEMERLLGH